MNLSVLSGRVFKGYGMVQKSRAHSFLNTEKISITLVFLIFRFYFYPAVNLFNYAFSRYDNPMLSCLSLPVLTYRFY